MFENKLLIKKPKYIINEYFNNHVIELILIEKAAFLNIIFFTIHINMY